MIQINQITPILYRIVAIVLFLFALQTSITFINITLSSFTFHGNENFPWLQFVMSTLIPLCIYVVVGIFLYRKSLKSVDTPNIVISQQLEAFIISLIGLILIVTSIAKLVAVITNHVYYHSVDIDNLAINYVTVYIERGIHLLFGVLLLFKGNGLALLLRKIRELGLQKSKEE